MKDCLVFTPLGAAMLKEDGLKKFMEGTAELGPWYPKAHFSKQELTEWEKKKYIEVIK
jgi:hypothetical protein